jgi:hypothetical protein
LMAILGLVEAARALEGSRDVQAQRAKQIIDAALGGPGEAERKERLVEALGRGGRP